MGQSSIAPDTTFTPRARRLGIVAVWTTFIVTEIYAVVSGMAYVSQGAAVESGPFLSFMALLVVVMGPPLVLSMVAVHAYAAADSKPYSLAALAFMLACVTITSCINFLLLIVSSRPDLFSEAWRVLFVPARWPAPAFLLDNFVWDWFFGISMLLAAPIFGGSTLKTALRLVLILGGALCLAGLLWLAVSPPQAVIIGILGWGAAGPIAFLLLGNLFVRIPPVTGETTAA
jgi:hypothetical protein